MGEPEPDVGMGHGLTGHSCNNMRKFGRGTLQEFESCRSVIEQVIYFDGGALPRRSIGDDLDGITLDLDHHTRFHALYCGDHSDLGYGCYARKRLTSKAHGAYGLQVCVRSYLARGVAQEGGLCVFLRHSAPVVRNPYQTPSCLFDVDEYFGRTGIYRVFNQFLDHRRGPIDHFTRGDFVHNVVWEYVDFIRHTSADSEGPHFMKKYRSCPA